MSNRIDVAIQDATEAVNKVMSATQPLEPGVDPEWTAEDRAAAARQLEAAIVQFRRHL